MPEGKGGDDLNVFEDLLKKKEQERAPSQPSLSPEPAAAPSWFGKPADPPLAPIESAAPEDSKKGPESISPILAPTEPVDDGGWDEGSEKSAQVAPRPPVAIDVPPPPAALGAPPAAASSGLDAWSEKLVPSERSSRAPAAPAVRLSGVPLPPPSSRLPPPPGRTSAIPKLAPPPTVGSAGPAGSSLTPGSLAPPVLTDAAFTSPAPAPPPPPPSRRSVAAQVTERSAPSDAGEARSRPIVSKQLILIAATLVVGVTFGIFLRGSGGSSANAPATLKAAAGQPGVKMLIDGREVGPLPREVPGITPGEHLIAFEGDRYAPAKKSVVFGPSEVKEIEPERLKVVRGAATFDVKTPAASLVLVSSDERRELSDYSVPIEVDATKSWTLEASKPGYETLHMPITFGEETAKTFVVTLGESPKHDTAPAPAAAAEAAEPKTQVASASAEPSKAADTTPASHKATTSEAPKTEGGNAAAPLGTCKLNINSIPVSKVLLDGKPIGLTPKVGVVVPAGSHTVVFVGENGRKSASSTCHAGETKAVSTHL